MVRFGADVALYRFINLPMQFQVEGLAVPGKVQVPLVDLVWRPDPKPDDPDEEDFLPDAPGSFVEGWYPIAPAEPLEEGQEFPEKAEMYMRLQISELLLPKEELEVACTPSSPASRAGVAVVVRNGCCVGIPAHAPRPRALPVWLSALLTSVCVRVCVGVCVAWRGSRSTCSP